MNGNLVETLGNSSLYLNYARAYTDMTGLPVALRPLESWQVTLHDKRKENPFCALMSSKSRTCAACLQMQEKLAQSAMEQPCTATCAYGLSETAVPVRLGDKTLGFLQTGQVFRSKPTNAQFARVAQQLKKLNQDLDDEALKKSYFGTPVVSQAKLDSLTNLLSIFAGHLSLQSNQIAVQQANTEPPVIARAKQFILDHLTEDLSLGRVSAAVHTSHFYFCKMFKKATGTSFTCFVSHARIEKAKNLLLNPNTRVSEIAFAVGFQSLTHFNRVFQKLVGQSPTVYRNHLSQAPSSDR